MRDGFKRVLLLQLRPDREQLAPERRSFAEAMGIEETEMLGHDVYREDIALDVRHVRAVVIGGSPCSVYGSYQRAAQLEAFVRAACAAEIPVLGVCFGGQLLAKMHGGQVARDPVAAEHGTFLAVRHPTGAEDPLFQTVPETFDVQCSHNDAIQVLPPGAVSLARSARCPVQAFHLTGTRIYGLQFHPERTRAACEVLLAARQARGECPKRLGAIRATLRETPHANNLLRRFLETIVDR